MNLEQETLAQEPKRRMLPNCLRALALSASLTTICVSAWAHAPNSCQLVFDALTKVATTPNHSYTTNTGADSGKAEASETVFVSGQKYIRARGKWMRIAVTSQEVLEQEKEKEEKGKSTCQLVRRESLNGDAAMLYSVHREYDELKEDEQIWVFTSTGLPLRVERDADNGGNKKKEHQSTRFEYGNIRSPM